MVSSSLELPAPKSEDSGPEETTLTLEVVVSVEELVVKRVTGGVDNPPAGSGGCRITAVIIPWEPSGLIQSVRLLLPTRFRQ